MFKLTREVRFAINAADEPPPQGRPANTFGGYPPVARLGLPLVARVTLAGPLDVQSQYLLNIKEVDAAVMALLPKVAAESRKTEATVGSLARVLFDGLQAKWSAKLHQISLLATPTLTHTISAREPAMMSLSQKFEFSAAHRLHNPALDEATNRALFGKCNNPLGHGHNYEVQVTLRGTPNARGVLLDLPTFERIVADCAIDKLDHKHLNVEVAAFTETIPSVENIAKVIYDWLAPVLAGEHHKLASVTVWETPKTWCEYAAD